ncbi:MAG: DoxX family protein [Cyclobacteriaceae bacterium]|jgi:hypothetical protein|nr:DoxX family protein [Cyclobacteriaceae bacterium]
MVKLLFYWGARVIAALILLQTLFFKFSGSAESVYIFSTVGMEPWGRIGIGVLELLAALLLLITSVSWIGALLSLGLMLGAIGMHLTLLGIVVQGDGGYLFILAVVVVICSVFVLWTDRERAIAFLESLKS